MSRPAIVRMVLSGSLALIVLACGGGDAGNNGVVSRLLCGGAAAPAPNQITLGCPAEGVDSVTVAVHLGGPTTSGDINGLKFDLVFDPAVLQFVPPAMEGSFLNRDGAATIVQAGVTDEEPGRLIVAIARQGAPGGLGAAGADQVVMTLLFGGVAAGTTTLSFENAAVVDSSLQTIPEITFGTSLTLIFE